MGKQIDCMLATYDSRLRIHIEIGGIRGGARLRISSCRNNLVWSSAPDPVGKSAGFDVELGSGPLDYVRIDGIGGPRPGR